MTAATVIIAESNGAGESVTTVTGTHMGNSDTPNMNSVDYPITPGLNSFEKWQRFSVTANPSGNIIRNLKVWCSAVLTGSDVHKTNAREAAYDGAQTYAQPSATDRSATYDYTQTMPVVEPSGELTGNLGIGGSLSGTITSTGYSDYMIMQIQTNVATTSGKTVTMYYQYDEVA